MLSAQTVAARYRAAWQIELTKLNRMVDNCREDGSSLPPNYWQDEHAARGRYHLALKLAEALQDE